MSFIADPIANFLSTYGTPLAKIFGISPKIPLVCAITPDGTALGGAGTVGDTDFLTNFTAAAGGAEAVKAFDVSRPVGLMCMVNPDGTAYKAVPYTEISFTWTQTGTDDPVIVSQNQLPDGVTLSALWEDPGYLSFSFNPLSTLPNNGTVEIIGTQFSTSPDIRFIDYSQGGEGVYIALVRDSAFAPANGVGSSTPVSTVIRIFP